MPQHETALATASHWLISIHQNKYVHTYLRARRQCGTVRTVLMADEIVVAVGRQRGEPESITVVGFQRAIFRLMRFRKFSKLLKTCYLYFASADEKSA